MSFHSSASNIWLENGHVLRAQLFNGDGEAIDASFDLNNCIGNNNGFFQWGGENFSHSCSPDEGIQFQLEGDDQVPILRACLGDVEGNYNWRDINLSERIGNDNGNFVFN